ncbi:MAG: DUF2461 domain-containing protein [Actinomycetota bacterium]|nr:MAG: DUF2461 domain-containing protein [Actinomycetota bacterium]
MAVIRFEGIPAEAFEFYDDLVADNTRSWWQAHRATYERAVRDPLTALLAELAAEFGAAQVFRPYRDTRFSNDKTPLKDHQGAFVGVEDAVGYYVQVSRAGLLVAGGWYSPQGQQVARFRAAIDSGHAAHVRALLAALDRQGWELDGRPLKTRPRGVSPDHPDLDLMRMRALTATHPFPVEPWMGTRKTLQTVRTRWRQVRPLVEWLGDQVGPAADPAAPPL